MKAKSAMNWTFAMMTVNELQDEVYGVKGCRTPEDCNKVCRDIALAANEVFVVISLNTKNNIINRHLITIGTLNSTCVHPREIFRPAIVDGAQAVVLAHNHPSGDPSPSGEDISVTRQLVKAGRLIDIHILDHVIIGTLADGRVKDHLSLRETGLVDFAAVE